MALDGLAAAAMMTGRPDRARHYLLESIERHPGNVTARELLARLEETTAANTKDGLRRCQQPQGIDPGTSGVDDCHRRNESRVTEGFHD